MFDEKTEKLIQDIANQYIDIFKIVKQICPKDFTTEQVILMFIKTESMFNNIQVVRAKRNKRKTRNGNGNGKKPLPKQVERNSEYYA